jgi:hypothetical protein
VTPAEEFPLLSRIESPADLRGARFGLVAGPNHRLVAPHAAANRRWRALNPVAGGPFPAGAEPSTRESSNILGIRGFGTM